MKKLERTCYGKRLTIIKWFRETGVIAIATLIPRDENARVPALLSPVRVVASTRYFLSVEVSENCFSPSFAFLINCANREFLWPWSC